MNIVEPPIMYYRRATGDNHHLLFLRPLRRRPERSKSQLDAELRKPDWDQVQPHFFEKNIYREHPTTASRSAAEVDDYRRANGVVIVKGRGPVAKPILDFEEARSFPDDLVDAVRHERNGGTPTCVEAQCWPVVLSGRDFLGVVQAGSPRTHAYVLPAVAHALSIRRPPSTGDGPLVVVLAPSRELVQQIHRLFRDLGKSSGLRSVCVHSGVAKGHPVRRARRRLRRLRRDAGSPPGVRDGTVVETSPVHVPCRRRRGPHAVYGPGARGEEDRPADQAGPPDGDVRRLLAKGAEKERALADLLEDLLRDEVERVVVFARTQEAVRKVRPAAAREELAYRRRSPRHGGGAAPVDAEHVSHRRLSRTSGHPRVRMGPGPGRRASSWSTWTFPLSRTDYAMFVNKLTSVAGEAGEMYTFFTPEESRYAEELVATLRHAGQAVPRELYKLAKKTCASVRPGPRTK
ncbi:hypothetical protein MTO96_031678 [Rhipicephalus appendiculatus]